MSTGSNGENALSCSHCLQDIDISGWQHGQMKGLQCQL